MKTSKFFSRMFAAFGMVMMFTMSGWGANIDISLAQSGTAITYPNGALSYTLTVTNNTSNKDATGIKVVDTLPAGVTYTSGSGTDWMCSAVGQSVTCNLSGTLVRSTNAPTLTINAVAPSTIGSIINSAIVSQDAADSDPDTDNNTATVTTTIEPSANLSVTKTDSKDPVTIGESYSYTLNVTNNGPSVATDLNVTDTLPNGMTYNGITAADWTCGYAEGKLQCLTSTLASGSSSSIIVNVTAPSAEGSIINSVSVSSAINDPDTANNTASEQTQVNSNSADLSILITDSPDPVTTTGALTYTVTVQNNSAVSASGIQVIDILPSNLQFVSVSGTGWTCSQGQYIVCDYVSGTGVLAANTTTSAITINVTAPATAGDVNNTVEVSSANPDPVITNNTAKATTTVNDGTSTTTTGRTFSKYLQYNVFGDMKTIGNTIMWPESSAGATGGCNLTGNVPNCKNNDYVMKFIDIDGNTDTSTYNSTSANLDLGDSSYKVVWAGLYWQGHLSTDTGADNTKIGSYTTGVLNANKVKLKGPTGNYIPISANNLDTIVDPTYNKHLTYSGFADVTSYVKEQGTYTVANIQSSEGKMAYLGGYGGWALQVIYKDPSNQLHYKNISIFDGYQSVTSGKELNISIDGFVTPLSGAINSSVSTFVADGDNLGTSNLNERFKMHDGKTIIFADINDSTSPLYNVFNSTIAEFGNHFTNKNPNYQDNLGIDIDRFNVSNFIDNNQTSTKFQLSTVVSGDVYYVDFLAFATDMYTPIIDGFSKTATLNGTVLSPTSILHAGDTLTYNLTFSNTGGETAKEVEIFDDFDLDGLNSVFNVDNFDASSIKLSVKNSTTTWQASPNCGYDSAQHKVWCKVAELKTGEQYTMQFAVTIKSSFSSEDNTSVTNTAYSKYKNGTTNEYVVLTSNGYGGQSNTNNAGTILAGGGVVPTPVIAGVVDVVDGYSGSGNNYNSWITTKVSAKPGITLKAVYLGTDPNNPVPQNYPGTNQSASLTIIYKLADMSNGATCENAPTVDLTTTLGGNTPVVSIIDPGETSQVSTAFVMGYVSSGTTPLAKKDVKIKYKAVDFNTLIDTSGVQCANKSSTGGVVEGIPACLITNSPDNSQAGQNYKTIFGQTAFDSCYHANGEPCYSSNGGVGAPPYDTIYGCFECSIGAIPYSCSRDNFAIRPEKLEIVSTHYDWANILRSGEEYNTTIHAYNFGTTTNIADYNVTLANMVFDINTTKYMKNNDINDSMLGTTTFGTSDFNMSNGISVKSGFGGNEVAGISFNDVGKINIRLEDRVWSAVDNDDTPMNCDANGTYVCGDVNVTFIPHHFNFSALGITNNNGNTDSFTYLANEVALMSGRITAQMQARNKAGAITSNFSAFPLWENPVTVVPVVTKSTYLYPDANETNISNQSVGFSFGAKTIAWDENNASQYLRFNFRRDINLTQNPFDVNGSNLNISMTSHYVDGVKVADINGSRLSSGVNALPYTVVSPADGNSTFVYGRIIPRDVRVFGTVSFSANAWYEVFNAPRIGATSLVPSRNDGIWYINQLHDDTNDGNGEVTVVVTGANPTNAAAVNGLETYGFAAQTPPYSAKAHINTDPWLWYGVNASTYVDPNAATNLDCLTHPCFNINVTRDIGRAGSATSDTLKDEKTNKESNSGTGITYDYTPVIQ